MQGLLRCLWLGKGKDDSNTLELLEELIPVYRDLLGKFAAVGFEWVQIDELILAVAHAVIIKASLLDGNYSGTF